MGLAVFSRAPWRVSANFPHRTSRPGLCSLDPVLANSQAAVSRPPEAGPSLQQALCPHSGHITVGGVAGESPETLHSGLLLRRCWVSEAAGGWGGGRRGSGRRRRTACLAPHSPGADNCWAAGVSSGTQHLHITGFRAHGLSRAWLSPQPPALSLIKAPHHSPG